jgi:hypothetical protein
VYVLPRPKAGNKISFGDIHSFFPPKLRNLELHTLKFVSGVPFPSLTLLLLVMVIVVLVVAAIQQ